MYVYSYIYSIYSRFKECTYTSDPSFRVWREKRWRTRRPNLREWSGCPSDCCRGGFLDEWREDELWNVPTRPHLIHLKWILLTYQKCGHWDVTCNRIFFFAYDILFLAQAYPLFFGPKAEFSAWWHRDWLNSSDLTRPGPPECSWWKKSCTRDE